MTEISRNPLPTFNPNEPRTAKQFQQIVKALQSGRGAQSPKAATPKYLANVAPTQVVLVEERRDYLVCNYWDDCQQDDIAIAVAKPQALNQSNFDGLTLNGYSFASTGVNTMTVTKVSDSTTENWQITQDYNVDDILYVIGNVRGGIDSKDDTGTFLVLIDMNLDARAWAKV